MKPVSPENLVDSQPTVRPSEPMRRAQSATQTEPLDRPQQSLTKARSARPATQDTVVQPPASLVSTIPHAQRAIAVALQRNALGSVQRVLAQADLGRRVGAVLDGSVEASAEPTYRVLIDHLLKHPQAPHAEHLRRHYGAHLLHACVRNNDMTHLVAGCEGFANLPALVAERDYQLVRSAALRPHCLQALFVRLDSEHWVPALSAHGAEAAASLWRAVALESPSRHPGDRLAASALLEQVLTHAPAEPLRELLRHPSILRSARAARRDVATQPQLQALLQRLLLRGEKVPWDT